MIPTRYVALQALPRTPNDKVDTLSLPAPVAANALPNEERVPPATDVERRLLELCARLLRRAALGVNDNFFDLGGDSLLATQLVSAVQSEFGVRLSMRARVLSTTSPPRLRRNVVAGAAKRSSSGTVANPIDAAAGFGPNNSPRTRTNAEAAAVSGD